MGTVNLIAYYGAEILGSKAIIGGFMVIVILVAFYNLLLSSKNIKQITLITIYGVITITSLILFSLVFKELTTGTWL